MKNDDPKFKIILISLFLIFLSVFILLVMKRSKPSENNEILKIGNTTISVEISDEIGEQAQGLSGRDSLCQNCGMLFVYNEPIIQNFWMMGMKFPLDFVFIRDGKVIETIENVPKPAGGKIPKVQSQHTADQVLEVNASFVKLSGIKAGDEVELK